MNTFQNFLEKKIIVVELERDINRCELAMKEDLIKFFETESGQHYLIFQSEKWKREKQLNELIELLKKEYSEWLGSFPH